MDNIPKYIACRHGIEPVEYPHPMLEDTLKETAGVIVYQEQVMEIAQVLSGYTLGQADILRRAMGKKDKVEMAAQRENFVSGAMEKGRRQGQGGEDFRSGRQIRRLRLQQEPRRRLRPDRLPDRLVQDQPPGRILCRVHEPGIGQHRQARGLPPGPGCGRYRVAAPRCQSFGSDVHRGGRGGRQGRGALCPGRDQERRRPGHGRPVGRAPGQRPVR